MLDQNSTHTTSNWLYKIWSKSGDLMFTGRLLSNTLGTIPSVNRLITYYYCTSFHSLFHSSFRWQDFYQVLAITRLSALPTHVRSKQRSTIFQSAKSFRKTYSTLFPVFKHRRATYRPYPSHRKLMVSTRTAPSSVSNVLHPTFMSRVNLKSQRRLQLLNPVRTFRNTIWFSDDYSFLRGGKKLRRRKLFNKYARRYWLMTKLASASTTFRVTSSSLCSNVVASKVRHFFKKSLNRYNLKAYRRNRRSGLKFYPGVRLGWGGWNNVDSHDVTMTLVQKIYPFYRRSKARLRYTTRPTFYHYSTTSRGKVRSFPVKRLLRATNCFYKKRFTLLKRSQLFGVVDLSSHRTPNFTPFVRPILSTISTRQKHKTIVRRSQSRRFRHFGLYPYVSNKPFTTLSKRSKQQYTAKKSLYSLQRYYSTSRAGGVILKPSKQFVSTPRRIRSRRWYVTLNNPYFVQRAIRFYLNKLRTTSTRYPTLKQYYYLLKVAQTYLVQLKRRNLQMFYLDRQQLTRLATLADSDTRRFLATSAQDSFYHLGVSPSLFSKPTPPQLFNSLADNSALLGKQTKTVLKKHFTEKTVLMHNLVIKTISKLKKPKKKRKRCKKAIKVASRVVTRTFSSHYSYRVETIHSPTTRFAQELPTRSISQHTPYLSYTNPASLLKSYTSAQVSPALFSTLTYVRRFKTKTTNTPKVNSFLNLRKSLMRRATAPSHNSRLKFSVRKLTSIFGAARTRVSPVRINQNAVKSTAPTPIFYKSNVDVVLLKYNYISLPTPLRLTPLPNRLVLRPSNSRHFVLPSYGFLYSFNVNLAKTLTSEGIATFQKELYSFSYLLDVKRFLIRRFTKTASSILTSLRDARPANPSFTGRPSTLTTFGANYFLNQQKDSKVMYDFNDLVFNDDDFVEHIRIKRIRFKPGYSKLWRSARSTLKALLGLTYRYQSKLTRYLFRFYRLNRENSFRYSTLNLGHVLMRSHFTNDVITAETLVNWDALYVNGSSAPSTSMLLFVNDFIQLIVHLKYYIAYRWITNWALKKRNRILKLKSLKSKTAAGKGGKQVSFSLPNWLLTYESLGFDIPKYLEVDYFTLSIFVIYEPFYYSDLNFSPLLNNKHVIFNMYNWKYIT